MAEKGAAEKGAAEKSAAVELFGQAACGRNVQAKLNLAVCFLNGEGVTHDDAAAFRLLHDAGDAGNCDAQCLLTALYHHGIGTAADAERALEWSVKAAESGSAVAMYNVGCNLSSVFPRCRRLDKTAAGQWFRRSAEAGFASAMCSLGRCLFAGNGVAKDRDEKGVELVRTNPNNTALNELVLHHEDGLPSQIDCPVLFVLIGPF